MLLYDLADRCIANIASFLNGEEVSSLIMTGCGALGYKLSIAPFSLSVAKPREKVALSYCHKATGLDLKIKLPPIMRDNLPSTLQKVMLTDANWECISRLPSSVTDFKLNFETSVEEGGAVLFPNVVQMLPMSITKAEFNIIGKAGPTIGTFSFGDSLPSSITDLLLLKSGIKHKLSVLRFPPQLVKLRIDGTCNASVIPLLPTTLTELYGKFDCTIDALHHLRLRRLIGAFIPVLQHPENFPELTHLQLCDADTNFNVVAVEADLHLPAQLKYFACLHPVANWGGCKLSEFVYGSVEDVPTTVYSNAYNVGAVVLSTNVKKFLDTVSRQVRMLTIKGNIPTTTYDFSVFKRCRDLCLYANIIPVALPPRLQRIKMDWNVNMYALTIPKTITEFLSNSHLVGTMIADLPLLTNCRGMLPTDVMNVLEIPADKRDMLIQVDKAGIEKIRQMYSAK